MLSHIAVFLFALSAASAAQAGASCSKDQNFLGLEYVAREGPNASGEYHYFYTAIRCQGGQIVYEPNVGISDPYDYGWAKPEDVIKSPGSVFGTYDGYRIFVNPCGTNLIFIHQSYPSTATIDDVPMSMPASNTTPYRGVFRAPIYLALGDKIDECNQCSDSAGNPIVVGTGDKSQREIDIAPVQAGDLAFVRTYHSQQQSSKGSLGYNWRHTYSGRLEFRGAGRVVAWRPNGERQAFYLEGGLWKPTASIHATLQKLADGTWRYTGANDYQENYDAGGKLTGIAAPDGLALSLAYDGANRLISVTDAGGRSLGFGYDGANRITQLTAPGGETYGYAYDAKGNLSGVTYPDATPADSTDNPRRLYHYENTTFPNHLTGITDENGIRYATYAYDAQGRGTLTEHAGGVERTGLAYNSDATTTVTDAYDSARTYTFALKAGAFKTAGQSQPGGSGCGPASRSATYDANGNIASRADFNGNKSCHASDLTRNLETVRVEGLAAGAACPANLAAYAPAAGTVERKILTEWHPTFRLPVKITEAGRETGAVYDAGGNVTSTTIKDTATNQTRTWSATYTYHASVPGVLMSKVEDGPRTDVGDLTTTGYYAPDASCAGGHNGCRGQISQITNALGHVTRYDEYDPHGRVTRMTDPNGVVTTLSYTPRGWLASRAIDGKTTLYDYTLWGGLSKVTYPDGVYVIYGYDPAHRLTGIADSAGRQVVYTLDNAGNRTKEEFLNPDGGKARELHRVFDALGRLKDEIEGAAAAPPRTWGYYANGELKTETSPKGDSSSEEIDALGRTVKRIDPVNGSARPTLMSYDALDRLISLTAPNGAATAFDIDGLGNLKQETSADRGALTAGYDDAGNRTALQDARGLTVLYQYDALNRITRIDAPAGGGLPAVTTLLAWDSAPGCSHGIGRLCQISHAGVVTTHDYDARGNRIRSTRVEDGETFITQHVHNDADRPLDLLTPSFETIVPVLDTGGRIQTLTSTGGGVTTQIAQNIEYAATGQIRRQTLGQTLIEQSYDAAGRFDIETATVQGLPPDPGGGPSDTEVPLPAWALWLLGAGMAGLLSKRRAAGKAGLVLAAGLILAAGFPPAHAADLDLDYDANGNVISKTAPGGVTSFTYDPLDRLDTEAGPAGARNHDFDANSNRTTDGAGTTAAYSPNSDRLATLNGVAVTLDAAGNLTADGSYQYRWNSLGQLAELRKPDNTLIATYYYDHRNLRTRKVTTAASPQGISKTFYHYDEQGRLIAETAPGNQPLLTYIWNGDILTGLIVHQPQRTVYTVQTDHLGSPFQVRTLAGQVVWRWESEAFGKTAPNEDVDGDGTRLTLNLRFPGQYFDKESGLHYNWNRYYSPRLGRYLSADPIGLSGGANLFAYVGGNPLSYIDPEGLAGCTVLFPDYPIDTGFGFSSTSLGGHGGVVSYDDVSGSTRYYEYGRYSPNDPRVIGEQRSSDEGNVRRIGIPDLVIDPRTGQPTPESLEALRKALSERAGHNTRAELSCDKDADAKKINKYAEDYAKDKNRPPYSWKPWSSNQCRDFANRAVRAGKR